VVPLTFSFNAEEDTIDVGGVKFGASKKWRDAQHNPKVTFLVDDVLRDPRRARAIEIRGLSDVLATGGSKINPRFPNFAEEFLRIRPHTDRELGSRGHERRRRCCLPAERAIHAIGTPVKNLAPHAACQAGYEMALESRSVSREGRGCSVLPS
jgi:PPOX class F420-dependent enzyme/OxyR family protein